MTDVRLTALNPEDSQVYPVACNTSGELKVEKQATFDGNLDGDLTVNGTVSASNISPSGNVYEGYFSGANPKALTSFIDANGNVYVGAAGKVDTLQDAPTACGAKISSEANNGHFVSQATSTAGAGTPAFAAYRGNVNTVNYFSYWNR